MMTILENQHVIGQCTRAYFMFDEITILTLLTIKTKSSLPWHVCQDRPLSHYFNIGNRKFLPIVLTTIFKLMKTRLNLNSRFTWHGVSLVVVVSFLQDYYLSASIIVHLPPFPKKWQLYYDACSLQTASIIVQLPHFNRVIIYQKVAVVL